MSENNILRVKLTSNFPYSPFLRQTPGSLGRWGNYQFYINDNIKECDWWVVYEGLNEAEMAHCPRDRTILITDEPPTIKKYNQKFLDQFSTIISCQRNLKHPHVINTQKAHPWMVGCRFVLGSKSSLEQECTKSYDELKSMSLPLSKTKLISVVSSGKKSTPGHAKRLLFTEELKKHFKDKLDVYGRGINNFSDKWDVIAPYKYHIAMENISYPDYYTEKLIDAFLGSAYPFYYGAPNINDYFPVGALQAIDINNTKKSIELIEKRLEENSYEKSFDLILKSRNLVLDAYNIFPFLTNEIFSPRESGRAGGEMITIKPEEIKGPSFLNRIGSILSRIKKF